MNQQQTEFVPSKVEAKNDSDKYRNSRNQILNSIPYTHCGSSIILSKLSSAGSGYEKVYLGKVGIDIEEGKSLIIQANDGVVTTSPIVNSYIEDTGNGEEILVLETVNSKYHLISQ